MVATSETKTIQGVPCTVVSDKLYLSGVLEERTLDYYAQDKDGNVWYFGEDTAELNANGEVRSTEGTWLAGRDGAIAGIFMPADPRVEQSFRQEYYKGQAEDHFRIIDLSDQVKTPGATSDQAILTEEWTPLGPTSSTTSSTCAGSARRSRLRPRARWSGTRSFRCTRVERSSDRGPRTSQGVRRDLRRGGP